MNMLRSIKLDHILFVIFFFAIFLLNYTLGNDYYWHVKAGEFLSNNGSIPSVDPFSFTFSNESWVMHEWLFEYFIYHLHHLAGPYAVNFLSAAIISITIYIVHLTAVSIGGNRLISLLLSAISFIALFAFILPRPHLFTYLFLAIYINALIAFKYRASPARLYWLPLIMLFWVNIHGGYIIGIFVLVLFIITEAADLYLISGERQAVLNPFKPLFATTALCVLVSLVNPYTYHHWLYPFQVMSLTSASHIVEWLSPDFHKPRSLIYLALVFGYFFLHSFYRRRLSMTETVLPLFFIAMSFISRRHIPIALIVTLPFYVRLFGGVDISVNLPRRFMPMLARLKEGLSHDGIIRSGEKGSSLARWVALLIIISGGFYLHLITNQRIELYEIDHMPVEAVEFINQAGIAGNVFNSYGVGGYLIYSLYPKTKVFIDGRLDLYGDGHFYRYNSIYKAVDKWREMLNLYPIDYVLIDNHAPLNHPLANMQEFKLIYRDRMYSIYLRNNSEFAEIIKKYGDSYILKS